jgi:hypothetical protein
MRFLITRGAAASLCFALAAPCLAAELAPAPVATTAPDAVHADAGPKKGSRALVPELGGGMGVGVPTDGLGPGPVPFLEGGVHKAIFHGTLAVALRLSYAAFSIDGTGRAPCGGGRPCVASGEGAYDWKLDEQLLGLELPVSYRFLEPATVLRPYAGLAPGVYFLQATVTSFDIATSQGQTSVGLRFFGGVELQLGPGAAFAEVGYGLVDLDHDLTGSSNLGVLALGLGYRVWL